MDRGIPLRRPAAPPGRRAPQDPAGHLGWRSWLAVLTCALLAAGCRPSAPRARRSESPSRAAPPSDSPARSTAASLSRSHYVDDTVCAECHPAIAEQFAHHPMGRSLSPADQAQPIEALTAEAGNPFQTDGFEYQVRQSESSTWHVAARIARDGGRMAEVEKKIDYAVGSGNRGRSYLFAEEGRVYQSPITWYTDRQKWDLSPGYEQNNQHFRRGVIAECLFCHANPVDPVPGSTCRYRQPIFAHGYAIGCQRCHGPGKAHVEAQLEGSGEGTIVNPARLSPQRREQVCQQCHLSTAARILRPGKEWNDYVPGEPLEKTMSIFTWSPEFGDTDEFVGQVEQMYSSRCFIGSDGRLGCISCHDPHSVPERSQRAAFYRQRCLNCHAAQDCGLPEPDRLAQVPSDSCSECHMPTRSTDLRHVASTDHRILSRPGRTDSSAPAEAVPQYPLVPFPPGRDPATVPARDRAIAVLRARVERPDRITMDHVRRVIPDLRQAVRDLPTDWEAWEALGFAWISAGRPNEAIQCFQTVVRGEPLREFALASLGQLSAARGDYVRSVECFQTAYRLNPNHPRYAFEMIRGLAGQRRWEACRAAAARAVEKFPENIGLRQLLVDSCLHLGLRREAEEAFQQIERFQPEEMEAIRAWYRAHPLR